MQDRLSKTLKTQRYGEIRDGHVLAAFLLGNVTVSSLDFHETSPLRDKKEQGQFPKLTVRARVAAAPVWAREV